MQEVGSIKEVLDEVLSGYKPKSFEDQFNLNGATNTAKFLGNHILKRGNPSPQYLFLDAFFKSFQLNC